MLKKCIALWREAHLEVQCVKNWGVRTTFGNWDVEKCTPLWREAHFQVKMCKRHHFRTTFGSWDVEKVPRRCGAKYISKLKCAKPTMYGPTTLGNSDVEKEHAVGARSTFRSQIVKNARGWDRFWKIRCPFASLHYTGLA